MRVPFSLLTLFLITPLLSFAGEQDYECNVEQVWQFADGGNLTPSHLSSLTVGRKFRIDRASGKIDSDFLPYTELEVVLRGSSKQPFVARTHLTQVDQKFVDWPNNQFLKVEEFRKQALKPFILVDVIDVKTGTCK